jgi:hypothetical protein
MCPSKTPIAIDGAVLEQVVGPRERVGVERVGAAPHGGATRGVDHAHAGAAATRGALRVAATQGLEVGDQLADAAQPALVDGLTVAIGHAPGEIRQAQVAALAVLEYLGHGGAVVHVHTRQETLLQVLLQAHKEVVEVGDVTLHPRLHQCFHGCREQVQGGLLGTAQAGTVAAGEGAVGVLVQEQGFQGADALVQIVDADEARRCVRQVLPQVPLGAQAGDAVRRLRDGTQRIVVTHGHAFHAALAGVGVDRDAEETAAARLVFLRQREVGTAEGELEVAEGLLEQVELAAQGAALVLVADALDQFRNALAEQQAHVVVRRRRRQCRAQLALELAQGPRQQGHLVTGAPDARQHRVEHRSDLAHQAGDRRVRADRVAVTAGGAVLRDPLRVFEANAGHVAEQGRRGRHGAEWR